VRLPTEVDRRDLLDRDEAAHVLAFRNRRMKGAVATRVGDGADDAQTRVLVEEVVAAHEGGPAPTLFVTRLRVEGDGNEVPFSMDTLRSALIGLEPPCSGETR
jgi:hypothetical protein